MSDAPQRIFPDFTKLTSAQRKVLAHIAGYCDDRRWMAQSTRHMAEATGLSYYTVVVAINRLNELQYIYTRVGRRWRGPSQHWLLVSVSGLTDSGLIETPRKKESQSVRLNVRFGVAGGGR